MKLLFVAPHLSTGGIKRYHIPFDWFSFYLWSYPLQIISRIRGIPVLNQIYNGDL